MAKDPGLLSFSPCFYFCCFIKRPSSADPLDKDEIILGNDLTSDGGQCSLENGKIITDQQVGSYGATEQEQASWSDLAKNHQGSVTVEKPVEKPVKASKPKVEVRYIDASPELLPTPEERGAPEGQSAVLDDLDEALSKEDRKSSVPREDDNRNEAHAGSDDDDQTSSPINSHINQGYETGHESDHIQPEPADSSDKEIELIEKSADSPQNGEVPSVVVTQESGGVTASAPPPSPPVSPATPETVICVTPDTADLDDVLPVPLADTKHTSDTPISDTSTLVPEPGTQHEQPADLQVGDSTEDLDTESGITKSKTLQPYHISDNGVFSDGDVPERDAYFYSSTELHGSTSSLNIDKKKKSKFRFKKLKFKKKKKQLKEGMMTSHSTPSLAHSESVSQYSTVSKYSAGALLASLDDLSDDDIARD